jgi:prevent-host-death family protein
MAKREDFKGPPKGRALIVDSDAKTVRQFFSTMKQAGFEVEKSSHRKDALNRIKGSQFDMVFCDLSLPKTEGQSLLKEIRQCAPEVTVFVMLKANDNDAALQASLMGATLHFVKPIQPRVFLLAARHALERRRVMAATRRKPAPPDMATSIKATEAKNKFGRILDLISEGQSVVITKHDAPKAVVLSVDAYRLLSGNVALNIDTLSAEFDSLLDQMQKPGVRAAMQEAFDASPDEMGAAAVKAARRRV